MKNQQGYTLIEILAALSISILVFGTASLLFPSIQLEWNSSTQAFQDQSQVSFTLRELSDELSHAPEIYSVGPTEWRYKTGEGARGTEKYRYRSLVYTVDVGEAGILSLYEIDKDEYDAVASIDYTKRPKIVLTDHLTANPPKIKFQDQDGNWMDNLENAMLTRGRLIKIELHFTTEDFDVKGGRNAVTNTKVLQIKLIKDDLG